MPAPLNCLLLEDSIDDAVLLVEELKSAGLDPQWRRAETEPQFREGLQAEPEIIFSDFSLPEFSIYRALDILKETGRQIPFIIVSGTIGEIRAVEALKAGATDYIMKGSLDRLGPAVQRALAEFRDRAERKKVESQLRESQELFQQLAENINEVFWISDPINSTMIYVSPAFETIWGQTCASLYESPQKWLESIHPEDRARVAEASREKETRGEYDEVYRIVRPDGEIRWIHDRGYPLRDEAGKAYRIVGTAEDVTKNRTLEDQFRQAQKLESIGLLAGGVAHDFNNILTVILGRASLILATPTLDGNLKESAEEIAQAAEHAESLTRQLLAFSRKQAMQARLVDLNEVASGVARLLRRVIGEDITLETSARARAPWANADPGMIEQAMINLAVNARDAMAGGGTLRVVISDETLPAGDLRLGPGAEPGAYVCISMSDTGCGIPPEIIGRVFEPFFTTKEPGKGTGLGLSSVYGIIKQHGGWVDVESEAGKGSTFRLYFPAAESPSVAKQRQRAAMGRGGSETILVVEDEESLRSLIVCVLSRCGYQIVEAKSGPDALQAWNRAQGRIDLLVTDLVMPGGMNGFELARQLLQLKPGLPVIVTSGYSERSPGSDAALSEARNFLQKPFSPSKMAEFVRNVLDQSKQGPA